MANNNIDFETLAQIQGSLGNIPGTIQNALLGPGAQALVMREQNLAADRAQHQQQQAQQQQIAGMVIQRNDQRRQENIALDSQQAQMDLI